jgi:isopenicillin N synthase-like dioxygenase
VTTIPTIDVAPLFDRAATRADTDAAILRAAREIGFMAVTGIPGDALAAATRRKLLAIFALPVPAKRAMCRRTFVAENGNLYRG